MKNDSIKTIKVNLINTNLQFGKIELNMMTLLIGYNGTGKSFLMKTAYVCAEVARTVKAMGLSGPPLLETAQFIINGCYDEVDFDGKMGVDFESGASLTMELKEGKVTGVHTSGFESIDNVIGVQYMSSSMRTFEAIKSYLVVRKMLMSTKSLQESYAELCKSFKLYDVKYIESIIQKMPLKVDNRLSEALEKFDFGEKLVEIDMDTEKSDFFYVNSDGKKRYATSLGKGHQSILNMMIGNS
jgi:hypothetical protein